MLWDIDEKKKTFFYFSLGFTSENWTPSLLHPFGQRLDGMNDIVQLGFDSVQQVQCDDNWKSDFAQ
jgi:hypothetical protein